MLLTTHFPPSRDDYDVWLLGHPCPTRATAFVVFLAVAFLLHALAESATLYSLSCAPSYDVVFLHASFGNRLPCANTAVAVTDRFRVSTQRWMLLSNPIFQEHVCSRECVLFIVCCCCSCSSSSSSSFCSSCLPMD